MGYKGNGAKAHPFDILAVLSLEALVVYVVAYDLKSPHDTGDDYDRVIGAVKAEGTTWCHLENGSAADVR